MLFANLPLSRQIKSARQHILADLRKGINLYRLTKQDAPRIRIRSLEVIPLSLSLPRLAPLSDITQAIIERSSLDDRLQLQVLSPFSIRLMDLLINFYSRPQPQLTKRLPPLLTWNPSSLATIHQQPSPKLNLILKRAQSHICLLQETNWTSVQYQHLLLSAPFCEILHSPAIGEGSSGVATFLPRPLIASSHSIVAPGYILSVSTSISGLTLEIINVYLHPKKIHQLGTSLLDHLQSDASRSHDFRFVGGDFNQADTKSAALFKDILLELNYSPPHPHPTFRLPNGYTSPLDLFLLQCPDYYAHSSPPKFITYWPLFHPTGHGIHICKISRNPPVAASPDDIVSAQIPSQIFYNPPSHSNNPTVSPAIRQLPALERSLLSLSHPTTSKVKATIWAWWHSVGQPRLLSPLIRIISTSCLENGDGPKVNLSPCPVRPGLGCSNIFQAYLAMDHYILVSVPLLSDLLVKYELLHPSHPTGPSRAQFTIPPLATWTKCRVAAPKIWAHQGAIKSADGTICTTTASLDEALRATRSFWQDFPTPYHPTWTSLLADYSQQVTPIPPCDPPGYNELYKSIITSPDSAPSADGIPLSAWRLSPRFLPEPSSTTLIQYYICRQHRPYSPWCSFLKQIKATTPITTGPSACPTLATVSLTGPLTLSLHLASSATFTLLRPSLTPFVNLKPTFSPSSNSWITLTCLAAFYCLTSPRPLKGSTPTGSCMCCSRFGFHTGLSSTVGTSFSVGRFFIRSVLASDPLSLYAQE